MPSELLNIEKAEEVIEIDSTPVEIESVPELQEYDVQTNSEGNWELELDNTFENGLHTVTVQDEAGNELITSLFAIEPDVNVYEEISGVSSWFLFSGFVFLLIILILAGYNLWRGLKTQKSTKTKSVKKFAKFETIFSSVLIVFVLSALVYSISLMQKSKTYRTEDGDFIETQEQTVMVVASGAVLDPVVLEPVEGVDLSLGNQSIHTSSSGRFNFNAVTGDLAIRLNHPELKRAVKYEVTRDFQADIYFDLGMMNILSDLINYEAKRDDGKVYDLVYEPLAKKVDMKEFLKDVEVRFEEGDLADQFIRIKEIEILKDWESSLSDEKYKRVYKVSLMLGSKTKVVYLVKNGAWNLVK